MNARIRKYSWQLAPADIREIRQRVFIDEQKVPTSLEWDDTDELADHFLMVLPDSNTPIGVARMFSTLDEVAHIGRMAILPAYRGQGFGEQLLQHLVQEAASDYSELRLSAQEYAIPFYQRSGFHVCSDLYDDAGIPHVDMRCFGPARLLAERRNRTLPMIAGEDAEAWLFDSERDLINFMDAVTSQARQRIWLYDRYLDHDLYDRRRFKELISTLARRHRLSEIRLLIHDDKPLVKRRHRLVELMRRLPSHIQLKLVSEEYPVEDQPFILADRESVVYRHEFSKPTGFAKFSDRGRVKLLEESFLRMWDNGSGSLELRELPL